MFRITRSIAPSVILIAVSAVAGAEMQPIHLTIAGGKKDLANVLLAVPVALDREAMPDAVQVRDAGGRRYAAQLTAPGLLAADKTGHEGKIAKELHVLVPSLKAGERLRLLATISAAAVPSATGFTWHTQEGVAELDFAGPPVLRYMHKRLDESSKESREQTFKVYHHLFDPVGKRIVTNGPSGLYPHHRGIFFGYRKVTYGAGKHADTWHCTGDAHQSHEKLLSSEAGNFLGRHCVEIAWHGEAKEVFAREERELTVYRIAGGTLVDFASRLRTTGGPVQLDGDPQHAGVHFRADKQVADKAVSAQTIFIRPDGVGKPGEEWNWPEKKSQVNLPWKAMSFVLDGQRYTVAILDRPENPKEARFSERTYGRFGSYFAYTLTPEHPLVVRYRFWLQEGQMTVAEVGRMAEAFTELPTVLAQ